jgi:hypothetical protein
MSGDIFAYALRSYVRRSSGRRGLSRRVLRKASNRKRRWFVDNIIMHHKRLHDRNRAIVVSNARTRALAKREALKNSANSHSANIARERANSYSTPPSSIKDKANSLRGRVDARRLRTRSRWLSVMGSSEKSTAEES